METLVVGKSALQNSHLVYFWLEYALLGGKETMFFIVLLLVLTTTVEKDSWNTVHSGNCMKCPDHCRIVL